MSLTIGPLTNFGFLFPLVCIVLCLVKLYRSCPIRYIGLSQIFGALLSTVTVFLSPDLLKELIELNRAPRTSVFGGGEVGAGAGGGGGGGAAGAWGGAVDGTEAENNKR